MVNPLLGSGSRSSGPAGSSGCVPVGTPRRGDEPGGVDAAQAGSMPATAASRSATAAPPEASEATTRTVSSPATVPITPGNPLRSSAEPTTWAEPGGVRSTIRLPE